MTFCNMKHEIGINDLVTPFLAVFLGEYYGGRDITVDDVYNTSDDILLQVKMVLCSHRRDVLQKTPSLP